MGQSHNAGLMKGIHFLGNSILWKGIDFLNKYMPEGEFWHRVFLESVIPIHMCMHRRNYENFKGYYLENGFKVD